MLPGTFSGTVAATLDPIVLGVRVGAALGLTGIRLPSPVDRFLAFLENSAGPTALFALAIRSPVGGGPALRAAALDDEAVVYPAIAWGLFRLAGLPPAWVAAGVLIAALPTATNVFVFAQRYDAWRGVSR